MDHLNVRQDVPISATDLRRMYQKADQGSTITGIGPGQTISDETGQHVGANIPNELFPAQLTAYNVVTGRYSWTRLQPDQSGNLVVIPGDLNGTYQFNPAEELNGAVVDLSNGPVNVWLRERTGAVQDIGNVFEFEVASGGCQQVVQKVCCVNGNLVVTVGYIKVPISSIPCPLAPCS